MSSFYHTNYIVNFRTKIYYGMITGPNIASVKMLKVLNFTYLSDVPYGLMYSCVYFVWDVA